MLRRQLRGLNYQAFYKKTFCGNAQKNILLTSRQLVILQLFEEKGLSPQMSPLFSKNGDCFLNFISYIY